MSLLTFKSIASLYVVVLFTSCTPSHDQRTTIDAPDVATIEFSDYTGEYTRTDGTPIYITQASEGLAVVVSGNVFALSPTDPDAFELVGVPERIRFERDDTGKVTATTDSQGTYSLKTNEIPERIRALFARNEVGEYAYAPPVNEEEGLFVGKAAEYGISEDSLTAIINDIGNHPDYANVHSLLVAKEGTVVLEEYFMGLDANQHHNLRSATKSVIAALVGIAVHRGDVSLQDRPLKRIAKASGIPISPHKAQLRLADLLDMRHSLRCDDWDINSPGNESNIYDTQDWTDFILNIPDAEDGAEASYCSAMPLMVGRYLELATGASLPDYADRVLFGPLGVKRKHWEWDFVLTARETPHGAQVHLRPRDMLRIAQLYERDGLSPTGERILPPSWIRQTFTADMPLGDWRRYNDFWWAYDVERAGAEPVTVHTASGIGGQRIAIIPALDLVVVMTGGSFSTGRSGPKQIIERVIESVTR